MGLHAEQLRINVIEPVCRHLGLYSPGATALLLGVVAQESAMGTYLRQLGGPALGICQMEPDTFNDIYKNFLHYRPSLRAKLAELVSPLWGATPPEMVANLAYSVAMARVHFFRVPLALPDDRDVEAMARYWKQWYNTPEGAGAVEEFTASFHRWVL